MNYQVYILFSKKLNRFYIGSTSNIEVRMGFHQIAESRKFTHKADDWFIFLVIDCVSKIQSILIEKHIKKMKSKNYIMNLLKYPEMIENLKVKFINLTVNHSPDGYRGWFKSKRGSK